MNSKLTHMFYSEKPENFSPKFEGASVMIECGGKILLLHRQDHKPEGNTWCTPGGKIDAGENPLDTVRRELREETGIDIPLENFVYAHKAYVRYPAYDFIYHKFHAKLDRLPQVLIRTTEHKDFTWVEPQKALEMNLIMDECESIKKFYEI